MILVDSSVWIDFLRGNPTPQVARLQVLLPVTRLAIGDLILTEVLQGIDSERDFNRTRELLGTLEMIELGGEELAIEAARNFRRLRSLGVSVRKTIDTIIATRCITDGHALLFSDKDFAPFVTHLGLQDAMAD